MTTQRPQIAAVVVTHDRLTLLQECVSALKAQTLPLHTIIVVANAPTPATREWLRSCEGVVVVEQANLGSAGGQHTGIKEALARQAEWVWCMDDDSLPRVDSLELLVASPHFAQVDTGLLCSHVVWKDGLAHKMNLVVPSHIQHWIDTIASSRTFQITSCSFVGMLVSSRAVQEVGLPIAEMFIWGDDVEYSRRITHYFLGFCVLDSIITHQTETNAGSDNQLPKDGKTPIKLRCFYRNSVAIELLSNHTAPVKLKNIILLVLRTLKGARSMRRSVAILLHSLMGIPFYIAHCRKHTLI